jgi:nucleoside-diphosphate-sugar epimerase
MAGQGLRITDASKTIGCPSDRRLDIDRIIEVTCLGPPPGAHRRLPATMKKVLITGASGYQGGFVVERLRGRFDLTLADRVQPRPEFADLRFLHIDVTSYTDVEAACRGQDAVVHLVAFVRDRFDKTPSDFSDVVVKGTWHVAEACVREGVGRLVNISSVIACGCMPACDQPYRVTDPCRFRPGDFPYCLSKHLGEQIGLAYHQAFGLSVINLRPGVIAGDGLNPGPESYQNPGKPWFMYVDPRDVAQAIEKAVEAESIGFGCYNIVATRRDSLFDWSDAERDLGYRSEHNWPEIPETDIP